MSAQPIHRFTHEEFLDREIQSPFRHEFRQGRIEMMAGGSRNHSLIAMNLGAFLNQVLMDRDCEVHGPELLVRIEQATTSTYPDVMVICGTPSYYDHRKIIIDNPTVIVEVLSPSTEDYDRGEKFAAYKQLSSLREYVLVHQDEPHVECFSLRPDGSWCPTEVSNISAHLTLESLGIEIPLTAIYRRVNWDTE